MSEPLTSEQTTTMDLLHVVAADGGFRAQLLRDGTVQIFRPNEESQVLVTIARATYDDLIARGLLISTTTLFTEEDDDHRYATFRLW